ncbi:hypothetical protein GFD17_05155 [Bifidobacterium sp. SMB2]|uniref:Uncharacterized protein n=1 Tax=Bifidobacterium saimiriisciurei TaxID=2661627 RepID=A0ABX0C838_9BIFI|nr:MULTISPECIES: hypothetical protein [Bifidobacterium]NEG96152.1 hypothetical protein [Bifidobacterium sp. SMB2]NEH10770.1 hypothetical protein [Bifidobacterium saimiriisciurei]
MSEPPSAVPNYEPPAQWAAPAGPQQGQAFPVQNPVQQQFPGPEYQGQPQQPMNFQAPPYTPAGQQPEPGQPQYAATQAIPTAEGQDPAEQPAPANAFPQGEPIQAPGPIPPNAPAPGDQIPGQPPVGQPPYGAPYGQPPVPGQQPQAQPTKSKKKLFIGLGIGGGVIVLAVIIALVAFFVLQGGKPKAEDYTSAMTTISKFSTKQSAVQTKIADVYSATYKGGNTFTEDDVTKVKEKVKDYKDTVDAFKDNKVMKDEKVKEKYDAYVKAVDSYGTYANNLAESAKPMSDAIQVCDDEPSSSTYSASFASKYNEYLSNCIAKLDTLSKVPDKSIAQFGTDMKDHASKISNVVKQLAALGDPTKIEYGSAAYDKYDDLVDQLYDLSSTSDITTDFSENLREAEDKASPQDEYNALDSALQDGFQEALSH